MSILLEWLDQRVNDGMGSIEFGLTENGDVGLFRNGSDQAWASGATAEEALFAAMGKYPHGKEFVKP